MNNNFLQSNEWREFQEAVGRKTFEITSPALRGTCLPAGRPSPYKEEGDFYFSASIIEHELPIVGKYFYISRGPIISCSMKHVTCSKKMQELINLAKKEKAGWIRIEPENLHTLDLIGKNLRVVKAPHDMQPRETLIMDISKSEEELLAGMKSKTRYNIKLAQKKGVSVSSEQGTRNKNYIEDFLRLNEIMAKRQGIATHNKKYYRKMFEVMPRDILKLYVAEYEGKIIAANIVIFYGDTAYYLHGSSDDKYKNVMAPHLLQWCQIQDARKAGCKKYDFCGVKVNNKKGRSWEGITKFKLGFSPNTAPIEFPGSYDIVVSPTKYWVYRMVQKVKSFVR